MQLGVTWFVHAMTGPYLKMHKVFILGRDIR